ncbi:MAG: replication initiation factor family protein [Circular genetic element sp.]|nr:MAG: replication initiation factor family protein [Circular genetic element sp.]
MTFSRSSVFCDWLDVTCHPDNSFLPSVEAFLAYFFYPVIFSDDGKTGYKVGEGVLVVESKRMWHRSSCSGAAVRELESKNLFRDYVNVLGSVGHNVTRLDAAVDLLIDAPIFLRRLEAKYPDDLFSFGRKALRVSRLYSARALDRAQTGTWYAGHRSAARVTARVYDKQAESLEKRGEKLPPTTRIELTFKKDYNCSLYDVLMPESLFYSHASPKLLEAPEGVYIAPWCVKGLVPWVSSPKDYTLTLDRFDYRVSHSPELIKLAELGSQFGDTGKAVVLRHFERLLMSAISARAELPEDTN